SSVPWSPFVRFVFIESGTTGRYTLSLHDALPIWRAGAPGHALARLLVRRLVRCRYADAVTTALAWPGAGHDDRVRACAWQLVLDPNVQASPLTVVLLEQDVVALVQEYQVRVERRGRDLYQHHVTGVALEGNAVVVLAGGQLSIPGTERAGTGECRPEEQVEERGREDA